MAFVLDIGQQGPPGSQGATGPQGLTGAAGPTGPPGTTTWAGIADKPAIFPSDIANVAGLTTALAGKSDISHTHAFASLTSRPTTISGYGITDAQPLDSDLTAIAALSGAGYLARDGGGNWTLGSVSGGDSTVKSAHGSRPAVSNDGNVFFPSDGFQIERDTGSAYEPWGPLFPLTAPPAANNWTAINQGSSTIADSKGGLYLYDPAHNSVNLRIYKKAVPSAPYTVTAAILPAILGADYLACGICLRESSSGKVVFYAFEFNTGGGRYLLGVNKYDSPTSFNNWYAFKDWNLQGLLWLQINDDNTNRKFRYSADGQNWVDFLSHTRTDFITPNEIGLVIHARNATYNAGMTVVSWAQA